jgi:uncharacterized protein YwgA
VQGICKRISSISLQLTGTWEHAVLAATAQAAENHAAKGYLGRTAMQKIVYFLQISGVPMRYRFDIYHYGPYCDRITRDVELLVADGVLNDISPNPDKYSNYRPAEAATELIQSHKTEIQTHRDSINRVVEALLPLEPDHLELLATLDYLYRQKKAGGGSGPWKQEVINRFMQVKKDKFERAEVSVAYDSMVRAKLIED